MGNGGHWAAVSTFDTAYLLAWAQKRLHRDSKYDPPWCNHCFVIDVSNGDATSEIYYLATHGRLLELSLQDGLCETTVHLGANSFSAPLAD